MEYSRMFPNVPLVFSPMSPIKQFLQCWKHEQRMTMAVKGLIHANALVLLLFFFNLESLKDYMRD